MKYILWSVILIASIGLFTNRLAAQSNISNQIENTRAEVRNDTLIITFDINTFFPVVSAWAEIRTTDGRPIPNNSLDAKVWDKVASGANRKIVWAYLNDGVDLSEKEIVITIKAEVLTDGGMNMITSSMQGAPNNLQDNPFGNQTGSNNQFNMNNIPMQANDTYIEPIPRRKKYIEKPDKEKPTAKYPLFRPGLEFTAVPDLVLSNEDGSANLTLTFEYIAKPSWSILSGVGLLATRANNADYSSIVIPLTFEYKLNTGRWFRVYGGGGIQNRLLINEDDHYLNIGQGLKRYVPGVKAEAGIEVRSIRLGITYHSDLTSYSVFDEKISFLGATLGWRFGGSKAYIKN
jgi:hypothetical protein